MCQRPFKTKQRHRSSATLLMWELVCSPVLSAQKPATAHFFCAFTKTPICPIFFSCGICSLAECSVCASFGEKDHERCSL